MTAGTGPAGRGSQGRRGQTVVEFALLLPILLVLFFAVLEGSLLLLTVGGVRYAAAQAATQAAELGNATYADTQQSSSGPTGAVQAIKSSPGVTALGTVTEVDIYRLAQQSNGQLTVDPNAYNRYRLDGSSISVTWPPSSRNVRNGSSDYLGVTIYYQYQWQSGQVLGATALQLSQTFDARIEPQRY